MAHSTELFAIEEDPFFVQDLVQMSKAANYRRWQFEMVAPYLKGNVLEIGGGIGNFTLELAGAADSVITVEPNAYCFQQLAEKTRDHPKIRAYNATVEALDKIIPPNEEIDAVVLMNVLEHIKDDHAILENLKRRLKPGGRIILLVPAGNWAFGKLDERLGHYRRYSKSYSRKLASALKMEIEKMRYYNFIGIWAWWWNAKVAHRENQNDGQIHLFDKYFVPLIARFEKIIRPPVGQTLLVVARKPSA